MQRPELIDFKQERIRTLHLTWIAFFISFYIWFNMAPLATTMLRDVEWLTEEHIKVLAIINVAFTIPARIIVGALIDRYGPRVVFSGLLITMSLPAFAFAFGNTLTQLMVSRLLLSTIGAGFVVGIRMVAQWFPPKMIGRAEGFYAGWGNFGSAWAAMTLPWFALTVLEGWFNIDSGWRWALFLNGLVGLVYGIYYYTAVRDTPEGTEFVGTKKTQPMTVSSYGDLVQYILWSFPIFGALGLLAWRISRIDITNEAGDVSALIPGNSLWLIYAGLGVFYVVHVAKTLQVNLPVLRAGVPEEDKYPFASVAALNTTYVANFGAELAVVSMLPAFFEGTFTVTPATAGLIASSFAFVNLFARPMGGLISDKLRNRKMVMTGYMVGISIGFLGMGFIDSAWPIWVAVAITVLCSIFVQGAEGATFAIIPLISRRMTGQVAGMAGAFGNVGAVLYLVLYSMVSARTFFFVLAAGAAFSFFYVLVFLKEPEGAFSDDLAAA